MSTLEKIKSGLNLFVNSYYCPAFFGVLAAISYSVNIFYPLVIFFLIFSCISVAWLKNVRGVVMPLILINIMGGFGFNFARPQMIVFLILVGAFAACAVYYLYCAFRTTQKFKMGTMFWGFIFAFAALLLSGCAYAPYQAIYGQKLIIWLAYFAALFVVYVGFTNFGAVNADSISYKGQIEPKYNYENKFIKSVSPLNYIMASLIAIGAAVSIGIILQLVGTHSISAIFSKVIRINNRSINSYAGFLSLAMIALVYFATHSKLNGLYLLAVVYFSIVLLFTYCRGVILFTIIVMIIVLAYSFAKSTKKKYYLASLIALLVFAVAAILVTYFKVPEMYEHFKRLGLSGNGRNDLYNRAWNLFKANAAFGIGFYGDPSLEFRTDKWCFHCTPLQLLTCGGVIGTLLLSVWFIQKYYVFYKNRSEGNMFLLAAVVLFAMHGIIDVVAFSFDKVLLVVLLCAFAEISGRSGRPVFKKEYNPNAPEKRFYRDFAKRILDFCIALFGLIVASPFLAVIALISRVKIGKPVLFAQPRPGKNCKVFVFYKFRSMKNAVDKNGNFLPDEQRITKWGKILRKTSLDELPQLWNILKGDMSIVGPRPRMVKDMVFYSNDVLNYYSVRPGLTGFDQVNGRNKNSWEKIFELDREYAEKCSFWLDVKLFFLTFVAVFRGKGSEAGSATSQREYWYSDYLLKTNKIDNAQYAAGLKLAKQIEAQTLSGTGVNIKEQRKEMSANGTKE